MKLKAMALHGAYRSRAHRFGGWALDRWAATLFFGVAGVIVLRWVLRGRPSLPAWHWLALGLLIVAAAGVLWLRRWASRRMYVVFTPEAHISPPAGKALAPTDKVQVHATGRFEVEGKTHFFADLLAYWRTFATREHAVMAIVHHSRFLLLGHMPEDDIGMWYIFFRPQEIEAITPGRLIFGATSRPALHVRYRHIPTASKKRKAPAAPVIEVTYLTFEDETARQSVWSDLLADT